MFRLPGVEGDVLPPRPTRGTDEHAVLVDVVPDALKRRKGFTEVYGKV